ncbi:MAG: NAD(P)/FAD-dependent oxidoreductase [Kineosporiaceae bacterium]
MPQAPDEPVTCDILIVGAGPVGLYGAYYAGARGLSVAVMDSLPEPGGQVSAMYPEKPIYDVAGFPAVKGRDLVQGLLDQAATFSPRYLLGQQAVELGRAGERPVVTSASGVEVHAGAVVLTAGIGAFTPRPLPAGDGWEGRGLAYFVPSLASYAGEDVVVVGGGDSAFDWAENLHPLARSVTLVHRTDRFRAHRSTVDKVAGLGIPIHTFCEVAALRGEACVAEAEIAHKKTGERMVLPATRVVAALGFTSDLGPLTEWGMRMTGRHIEVDTRMQTSVPRVFAAGDVTEYPGKVRLISVGFGEAATAVNNAAVVVDPSLHLFPGHSSDHPETYEPRPDTVPATTPATTGVL